MMRVFWGLTGFTLLMGQGVFGCATISFMREGKALNERGKMPLPMGELKQGVWVIAHRGVSMHFPENTIPAFDQAVSLGANMIEFDVIFTSDLVPVVIHDETLDRTTNGRGKVHETTFNVVKNLDAGTWKARKFAGTKVPTLNEVLQRYGDKIALNIELKKECAMIKGFPRREAVRKVLELIKKTETERRVLISSFDHKLIHEVRKQNKTIPVAFLTEGESGMSPEDFMKAGVDAWNVDADSISPNAITDFRARGRHVLIWGSNDSNQLKQLLSFGISGAFVDDPKILQSILK